jgi:hypothetical protein
MLPWEDSCTDQIMFNITGNWTRQTKSVGNAMKIDTWHIPENTTRYSRKCNVLNAIFFRKLQAIPAISS